MATSTGPDLSGAMAAVEALMDDEVVIKRADTDPTDDVLDPDTLQYVRSPDTTVYTGRASLVPSGRASETVEAGVGYAKHDYRVNLPLAGTEGVQRNDVVTVLSARRDQTLVGLRLRVTDVLRGTFAVSRTLLTDYDR